MSISPSFNTYIINYWVLIPAALIIIILSILEKRKSRQDICDGRPALLIPFRFLDGYENRTAYSMAFGTATSTVVSLITSERTLEFDLPLWATALYVYLQAIIGCLTCFPLFACLTTRYRPVGAVLCILYSCVWLSLKLVQLIQTVEQNTSSNSSLIVNNDTGNWEMTAYYDVMQGLPILVCYLVLIVYCFYILNKCYTDRTCLDKRLDTTVKLHQEEHVRWVLRKYRIDKPNLDKINWNSSQTFVDKMKDNMRLRYFTNFSFFKYPARMVALSFVQLNILYWAGLLLMKTTLSILYPLIHAEFTQKYVNQYVVDLTIIFGVCSAVALIICILNGLAQIFIGARNYRYDMLKIYQGNRTFVPVLDKTPQNILTRSMTFPGYQVAFMLWGILMCFGTVFILTVIPVLLLYFTAKFNVLKDVFSSMAQVLTFPVTVFAIFYLQVFMTKRVLLQDKLKDTDENRPLNVDNRKFYEIVNYSSLFTNMTVGLFTCLFRIVQSAFFGIFATGRLDRSVFPHELESWDRGYAAYISMLLVDNAHNNPSMRVFAHLLWTKTLCARLKQINSHIETGDQAQIIPNHRPRQVTYGTDIHIGQSPNATDSDNPWIFIETKENKRSNRARERWFLAYTLINNPQLMKLRKHKLTGNMSRGSKPTSEAGCSVTKDDVPLLVDIADSDSSSSILTANSEDVLLNNVLKSSSSSA